MIARQVANYLGPVRRLSAAEERELAGRRAELSADAWRASPERRSLIEHNIPLALKLAGAFARRSPLGDDAFGVALLSLCRSADRFDPARGNKFSTYATRAILNEFRRARMAEVPLIAVPEDVQRRLQAGPGAAPLPRHKAWVDAALPDGRAALAVAGFRPGPGEPADRDRPAAVAGGDLAARVRAAVDALPPGEAEAVRLYYLAGESRPKTSAIGRALGLDRDSVAVRLRKARRRLALSLAPGREVAS